MDTGRGLICSSDMLFHLCRSTHFHCGRGNPVSDTMNAMPQLHFALKLAMPHHSLCNARGAPGWTTTTYHKLVLEYDNAWTAARQQPLAEQGNVIYWWDGWLSLGWYCTDLWVVGCVVGLWVSCLVSTGWHEKQNKAVNYIILSRSAQPVHMKRRSYVWQKTLLNAAESHDRYDFPRCRFIFSACIYSCGFCSGLTPMPWEHA